MARPDPVEELKESIRRTERLIAAAEKDTDEGKAKYVEDLKADLAKRKALLAKYDGPTNRR